MTRASLGDWVPRLTAMTAAERATLPGVSPGRAPQLLAGAIVAEAAMDLLGVDELDICPWALREGVILRRIYYRLADPGTEGPRCGRRSPDRVVARPGEARVSKDTHSVPAARHGRSARSRSAAHRPVSDRR